MQELLRNQPAVRQKWTKFVHFKQAVFDATPPHPRLCSEHFAEYGFAYFLEYHILKWNLKPTAFPSVQKAP